MQQRFGIGGRAEPHAASLEFGAQFRVIVDFAVEAHHKAAVGADHRLGGAI
jgi:hypothetical protein